MKDHFMKNHVVRPRLASLAAFIFIMGATALSAETLSTPLPEVLAAVEAFEAEWINHAARETTQYNSGQPSFETPPDQWIQGDQLPCLMFPQGRLYFKAAHFASKICKPGSQNSDNYSYIDQENGYLFSVNTHTQGTVVNESFWEVAARPLSDGALFVAVQSTGHGLNFYLVKTDPVTVSKIIPDGIFPYLKYEDFYPEPQRGNAPPQFSGGLNVSAGNGLDSPLALDKGGTPTGHNKRINIALPHRLKGDIVAYAVSGETVSFQTIKMKSDRTWIADPKTAPLDSEEIIDPAAWQSEQK